jgi:hypothetical protein
MNLVKYSRPEARAVFHAAACALGIAMLLLFPANAVQHFGQSFRTVEFRHSIVRHTFIANPGEDGVQKAEQVHIAPAIPVGIAMPVIVKRPTPVEPAYCVPSILVLHRFKLGPTRSSGSDPLS